jgi:hypothetical protein
MGLVGVYFLGPLRCLNVAANEIGIVCQARRVLATGGNQLDLKATLGQYPVANPPSTLSIGDNFDTDAKVRNSATGYNESCRLLLEQTYPNRLNDLDTYCPRTPVNILGGNQPPANISWKIKPSRQELAKARTAANHAAKKAKATAVAVANQQAGAPVVLVAPPLGPPAVPAVPAKAPGAPAGPPPAPGGQVLAPAAPAKAAAKSP